MVKRFGRGGDEAVQVGLGSADQGGDTGQAFRGVDADVYKRQVDGKPLKGLKVDKVAGASWTSDAFNKALEVARQEASIQE